MDLGIGRGDSARASWASRRRRWRHSRRRSWSSGTSSRGERSTTRAGPQPAVDRPWKLPVWVAGYGPMALAMTGRVADGVILQLADPDLIRWFVAQVREAAVAAGRDPASIKVQAAAPAHVGPLEDGRERTRWFPALVEQPRRRPRQQVPARAAAGVPDRLHPGPDRLRLPPPRRGRLVQRRLRRRRGHGPVLRPRLGRGARREAARAGRRRRRPVQPLPDERRRGGPARGLRPRRHPGPARLSIRADDRPLDRMRPRVIGPGGHSALAGRASTAKMDGIVGRRGRGPRPDRRLLLEVERWLDCSLRATRAGTWMDTASSGSQAWADRRPRRPGRRHRRGRPDRRRLASRARAAPGLTSASG